MTWTTPAGRPYTTHPSTHLIWPAAAAAPPHLTRRGSAAQSPVPPVSHERSAGGSMSAHHRDRGSRIIMQPGLPSYAIPARTVETRPRTASTLSVIMACIDSSTSKA
jgi:hypothetical protein